MPERTPARPTRTVAAGRLRALMESLLRAAGCDDQGARACAARERSLEEGVPVYEAVWGKTACWAEKLGVEMPD
jgi:LDH2 family malate/lactate/ureidoglycolate dehydrogenase